MAYSDKVIDHYQNPRNVGSFGTSKEVKERKDIGVGIVGAPECGDVMPHPVQPRSWQRLPHGGEGELCSGGGLRRRVASDTGKNVLILFK